MKIGNGKKIGSFLWGVSILTVPAGLRILGFNDHFIQDTAWSQRVEHRCVIEVYSQGFRVQRGDCIVMTKRGTSKLTIETISPYFTQSIQTASKELGICCTLLKKVQQ